jgi:hypothetical protein
MKISLSLATGKNSGNRRWPRPEAMPILERGKRFNYLHNFTLANYFGGGTIRPGCVDILWEVFMAISDSQKRFHGLTLRCLGAIGIGLAFVIAITTGLIVISGDSENEIHARTAAYTLKFPEDEQMLKDLSAQILRDSAKPSKTGTAADIEPAAGDKTPADKQEE